jgi:DNA processing protein
MNVNASRDLLIALSLLPFLTPNRTRLLIETFDPLELACNASATALMELLSLAPDQAALVKNPLTNDGAARIAALREQVVTLADDDYPPLLREIIDPPLVLHVRGNRMLLSRLSLAVVGSRRATPYGVNAAAHLTRQLAAAGIVIVSGGARGIDAAAHHASLEAGGSTVAVLGTGIDVVYPRAHKRLFERIAKEGLLVSEFPPGTAPRPENFPMRNRVISGLSAGTVIVEATGRSGSLITARMAAEQGREVFAVPGSIFSAGSEGTHRLVQYGAKLVHDVDDIVDEIPGAPRLQKEEAQKPDEMLRELLEVFSREDGEHLDTVAARLGRTPAMVAESILQLELQGWIRALPGARYIRVK